jgi:autotransporter passenger strand-loop-strand repeat protein
VTTYIVSSGMTGTGLTANNGDVIEILSGGTATSTTISGGGREVIRAGAPIALLTVYASGLRTDSGSASGATLSGGEQIVETAARRRRRLSTAEACRSSKAAARRAGRRRLDASLSSLELSRRIHSKQIR